MITAMPAQFSSARGYLAEREAAQAGLKGHMAGVDSWERTRAPLHDYLAKQYLDTGMAEAQDAEETGLRANKFARARSGLRGGTVDMSSEAGVRGAGAIARTRARTGATKVRQQASEADAQRAQEMRGRGYSLMAPGYTYGGMSVGQQERNSQLLYDWQMRSDNARYDMDAETSRMQGAITGGQIGTALSAGGMALGKHMGSQPTTQSQGVWV